MTPRRCECPPREGVGPGRPTRDRPRPHPGRSLPSPVRPCGCRDHRPYPRSAGPPAFPRRARFSGRTESSSRLHTEACRPRTTCNRYRCRTVETAPSRRSPAQEVIEHRFPAARVDPGGGRENSVQVEQNSIKLARGDWLCEGLMACLPGAMRRALEGEMFVSLSDVRALRSGSVPSSNRTTAERWFSGTLGEVWSCKAIGPSSCGGQRPAQRLAA